MKFKFPYNINDVKRMAKRALGAVAIFTVPFVACHKDPVPTPTPTPTPDPQTPDTTQVDTTTIIEPTYPDTVWFSMNHLFDFPPIDSINFFAQKENVKKIIMKLEPSNATGLCPLHFHRARDTLSKRIDVNPQKVCGAGTIYINTLYGATLPDPYSTEDGGMTPDDSIFFTTNGWTLQRGYPFDKKTR